MNLILNSDRIVLDIAWDNIRRQANPITRYEIRHHVHNIVYNDKVGTLFIDIKAEVYEAC